jgi:DNA repair exonuclease SbcCD ATPase subunit
MEKSIAQVIEDSEKQTQRNDDLFGRLESMEQRLKDLDKVGSGDAAVAQVDISKRVAEALAHTEKNEEELDKLQKMMQESVKALDMKLESLSSVEQNGSKESNLEKNESQLFERMSRSEEEVKKVAETLASLQKGAEASQTTLKELGQRVMKAEAMVEASEAATMAVREELMCAPVRSSSAQDHQEVASGHETVLPEATLTKLEEQVAGFSKQVADELQELVKHQATLATMKEASANTESLTAIEDQVQDLAAKVAEELSELRGHQKELGKAKDSIGSMAKVEEDVHEMYKQVAEELKELRAHQKDLGKARDLLTQGEHRRPLEALSEGSPQLEAKVEELSREVVAELKSLASHQNELNGTKATMQDLAERMDDNTRALAACQKATSELKEEMESLKAKALLSDNRKPSLEPLNFGKKEVKSESKKSPKTSPTSAAESSKSAPEMESTNSSREEARPCGVQSPVRSGLGPLGRMGLSTQAAQNTSKEEEEAQNTSIAEEISDGSMSYGHEAFDEADEDSMSAS